MNNTSSYLWPLSASLSIIVALAHSGVAVAGERPRLSTATTYLLEPLGDNGLPDYWAAINTKFGATTKPPRNAVALLREAIGFDDMSAGAKRTYVALLGAEVRVAPGASCLDSTKYARANAGFLEDDYRMAAQQGAAEIRTFIHRRPTAVRQLMDEDS